jgi:hypothetical protein
MRSSAFLFHLLTAVSAVKYDDLRPLMAVGITSSVLLAQHFGCSKRWINQLKREASPAGAPALAHLHSVQSLWGNYLSSGKVPLGQKSAPTCSCHTCSRSSGLPRGPGFSSPMEMR